MDCSTERINWMTPTSLPLSPDGLAIGPDRFPTLGDFRLVPAQAPSNGPPLTLAEVVDHEAMAYRAWGTPTGEFLARQVERLAQLIRWTGATTPEEHESRMEVWDEEVREQWYDRGYHDGREAGRNEAARIRRDDRD
jgi:hypothetical protein